MTDTTASIHFIDTNGSNLSVAVAENLWLGPEAGWMSGTGVTIQRPNGTSTLLPTNSVYKYYPDPAACELLNLLPCPAVIDATDTRSAMIKTWKTDRPVTVRCSRRTTASQQSLLVLHEPKWEGTR
jgi:hypothetical protein